MQVADENMRTLVGLIYDAAIRVTMWKVCLARVAEIFCGSALMYRQASMEADAHVYMGANLDVAMQEPYQKYYSCNVQRPGGHRAY